MSGKKRLGKGALAKLQGIKFSDKVISVAFGPGPLGLQILHIPAKGVLVWHLDGQAMGAGELRIGSQVVTVAGKSCEGLDLEGVFDLVRKEERPVVIQFRLPIEEESESLGETDSVASESSSSGTKVGTQVRLEQVDRSLSTRLRRLSVNHQDTSTPKKDETTVSVVFKQGPLGLQISDVGKRVLVTSFENNPDGSMGQAEKSGLVHFGSQVIRVGKIDCEGMNMHEIGMLVAKQKRPVVIEFRKLYEKSSSDKVARAQKKKKANKTSTTPKHAVAATVDMSAEQESGEFGHEAQGTVKSGEEHTQGEEVQSSEGDDVETQGPSFPDQLYCTCNSASRTHRGNPMFFHFQMLCKSAQIRISLDYENSNLNKEDAHASFELSMLPMNTLYKQVIEEKVEFCEWPAWIRTKYIEAYIQEQKRAKQAPSSPRSPRLNDVFDAEDENTDEEKDKPVSEGELCEFCKHYWTIPYEADPNDIMYWHFFLLFQTVRILAERDSGKVDQQAYVEYLDNIDIEKLYESCKEDGKELHKWIDWIKQQCIWGYENELFKISLSGDKEVDLRDMIKDNKQI